MSYRRHKRNLSKIKLHTPREHQTITKIEDQPSRYHSELIRRFDFANGKHTFADPVMDNYADKWEHIVKTAKVGDGLMDLQENPKTPGIYSGDSTPMLVPKKEWEALQIKFAERQAKEKAEAEEKAYRGLRVVENLDDDPTPEEISGLREPQLITLNDDQVFEIGAKLQESNDQVNVNTIPGGLGLEIYGPKVWLVLAREKKNNQ